jgi:hypothetical protein
MQSSFEAFKFVNGYASEKKTKRGRRLYSQRKYFPKYPCSLSSQMCRKYPKKPPVYAVWMRAILPYCLLTWKSMTLHCWHEFRMRHHKTATIILIQSLPLMLILPFDRDDLLASEASTRCVGPAERWLLTRLLILYCRPLTVNRILSSWASLLRQMEVICFRTQPTLISPDRTTVVPHHGAWL